MNKGNLSLSFRLLILSCFTTIIFVFILSIPFSCSFKEPVAPQWDVNLPIPLMNRAITMQELVDKNDFIILNPNGLVSIDFEEELDEYEVGDELKVEGIQETFTDKIGKIEIQSPGANSAYLTMNDLYPPASLHHEERAPTDLLNLAHYKSPGAFSHRYGSHNSSNTYNNAQHGQD